jgi:SARP family transcriptional regulator, regulator of embCAB operon
MTAEFSILGPVEIRLRGRTVVPGGSMLQILLGTFLVSGNKVLTVEKLEQELWGTTPPLKRENALQAQISRLRRTLARLEPERVQHRITTNCTGYQFAISPNELDSTVFLQTLKAVRNRARRDLYEDIAELRSALALWRGPIFGGLSGDVLCQAAAAKLEEARITALELLYDLELQTDEYAKVIPELTQLIAENPFSEQFCGLLMAALYRSGRQIDALDVFRKFRHRLAEELGVDPSPTLRHYEKAVLNHDPLLMQLCVTGNRKWNNKSTLMS